MKKALVATILLGAFAVVNANDPTAATSREGRWKEDLAYLAKELPAKHKDFAKLIPKKQFRKQVRELERDLPQLSDAEIVLRLKRLVASLGVAHTSVGWPSGALAFHSYPIFLYWYSDGPAVVAATAEYREAIGARVVEIGSLTPQQAEAAVAAYFPYENPSGLHNCSPHYLRVAEVLQSLGIASPDGQVRFLLRKPDGQPLALKIAPIRSDTPTRLIFAWEALHLPTPPGHKRSGTCYWFEILPETQALYIQYTKCRNDPNHPFQSFVKDVVACADSNSVRRVIVDLRDNAGGDSRVVQPLVSGLKSRPKLSAKGQVYALISRHTFSSGIFAAVDLRNELGAILVGEPTGAKPNWYGLAPSFKLPNSQLEVWYSTRYFRLIKNADPPALDPDLAVALSLEDFLAGRDPALEAALHHVP